MVLFLPRKSPEAESAILASVEPLLALAWAKSAVEAHLEGTLRDFLGAVECLPGDPEEAQRKMAVSLIRFREFFGLSI